MEEEDENGLEGRQPMVGGIYAETERERVRMT